MEQLLLKNELNYEEKKSLEKRFLKLKAQRENISIEVEKLTSFIKSLGTIKNEKENLEDKFEFLTKVTSGFHTAIKQKENLEKQFLKNDFEYKFLEEKLRQIYDIPKKEDKKIEKDTEEKETSNFKEKLNEQEKNNETEKEFIEDMFSTIFETVGDLLNNGTVRDLLNGILEERNKKNK